MGLLYHTIAEKMIQDAREHDNFLLVHFERMISEPSTLIQEIYQTAGLDLTKVKKFRLQAKPSMNQKGQRKLTFGTEPYQTHWFALDEIKDQFRQDINHNQIARLSDDQIASFLEHASPEMEQLGYLPAHEKK